MLRKPSAYKNINSSSTIDNKTVNSVGLLTSNQISIKNLIETNKNYPSLSNEFSWINSLDLLNKSNVYIKRVLFTNSDDAISLMTNFISTKADNKWWSVDQNSNLLIAYGN